MEKIYQLRTASSSSTFNIDCEINIESFDKLTVNKMAIIIIKPTIAMQVLRGEYLHYLFLFLYFVLVYK